MNLILYVEPHIQKWLIAIFTNSDDAVLSGSLKQLFHLMVVLNLPDAVQMIMGGIFQVSMKAFVLFTSFSAEPIACRCLNRPDSSMQRQVARERNDTQMQVLSFV